MNLKRDTYAIVDLDHLKYNVELAHSEFKRPLMAVIKASFLKDIDYIEMFAVATLQESIELRELGINKGILILGAIPTSKEDIDLAIKYDISLTMVSVAYLKLLDHLIDKGQTLKVHIKLDTGMHRIAFEKQRSLFYEMIGNCKFKYIHCCNSAAMTYHHDEKSNMGRLGITMYGCSPNGEKETKFKQVMSLYTKVAMIKKIPAGDQVGYGLTYTAKEDEYIATLPIGYADGFIRKIGDQVEIFGEHISLESMAKDLDTISYEVLCLISKRVPRVYVQDGQVKELL